VRSDIRYSPAYGIAFITLNAGEQIKAEAGAMVSMSTTIRMTTGTQGGVFKGLKRSVLGGESFFINTFLAESNESEVSVAPALPGDIIELPIRGDTLFIQSGSFLASTEGVELDTKFGGGKTFFSREGLFLLKATGNGIVWVSSYGAIHVIDLAPGQQYIVDTGHMVAFDSTMQYDVSRAAGWKSTIFGGEGLVVRLTGPGRFYMQTRAPESFIAWLAPQLPGRRS
jgi:uncharacterized protein (TIGR00266 family)